MEKLSKAARKVQDTLHELGYDNKVKELPESTRTAKEAAEAISCDIAQIAKSIVFKLKKTEKPVLVIASGINRINEKEIEKYINDQLGKADASFVRDHTGYVIGGVPPLGHHHRIDTFIDEDLFQFEDIWAAAGHPKAVFKLSPEQLKNMTDGQVISIK
ncbi:MAG TPA: YbaK/EbsC family protein [Pseudogracilibacillus sp.]|nr:YbaK/EbsC family protein [Pseudogracilibacillus sp.]